MVATEGDPSALFRIQGAARNAFIELGYEATSIDGIARAAKVSKETIYAVYPNKMSLFYDALRSEMLNFELQSKAVAQKDLSPEEALYQHGINIGLSTLEGGYLSVVWLAISAAREWPQFSDNLKSQYTAQMLSVQQSLARCLGPNGHANLEDAEDFGAMIAGGPKHVMVLPAVGRNKQIAALKKRVQLVVQLMKGEGANNWDSGSLPDFPAPPELPEVPRWPRHISTAIETASSLFLDRGFHNVSMELICEESRVGRGTLYRHFGNKAGVFDACMRYSAINLLHSRSFSLEGQKPCMGNPITQLANCLEAAASLLTCDKSIALHRTLMPQARTTPYLAHDIYHMLRAPYLAPITEWLHLAKEDGQLSLEDPATIAECLLTLAIKGNRPLVTGEPLSDPEISQRARKAISMIGLCLSGEVSGD